MGRDVVLAAPPGDPLGDYLRAELDRAGLLAPEGPFPPPDYRGLVLTRVTPELALEAPSGGKEGQTSVRVFRTLWMGRPVWAPRRGLEWGEGPEGPLGRRALEGLGLLLASGLVVCPLEEVVLRAGWGEVLRGAVTARRVEEAARRGCRYLTALPGAAVTPLARDRARALGIHMERGEDLGGGTGGGLGVVYPKGPRPGRP